MQKHNANVDCSGRLVNWLILSGKQLRAKEKRALRRRTKLGRAREEGQTWETDEETDRKQRSINRERGRQTANRWRQTVRQVSNANKGES